MDKQEAIEKIRSLFRENLYFKIDLNLISYDATIAMHTEYVRKINYSKGYIAALMDAFGISESEITVNTNGLQELADQFGIKVE